MQIRDGIVWVLTAIGVPAWINGLVLFVVVGLVLILEALARLKAGDQTSVARTIGTRSAEEEVEEQIRALQERQSNGGRA